MGKFKKTAILTMVAMGALFLTACGATKNSSAPKEVKFFNGKVESVKVMDQFIKEFNKENPKYKVVQEFNKDASSALTTKFASGDVPDIVSAQITQDYIDQGLFEDLSGDSDLWKNVDPSVKDMLTDVKSGKQYQVALTKSIGGVFYNKDLVSEVKTDNWTDFTDSIKTTKSDVTPMFLGGGGSDSWTLGQLMDLWGFGQIEQKYSYVEATKNFISNDQKVLNFAAADGPINVFANRLMSMKKDGVINSNAATASYNDQITAFATGKAVTMPQGIWALSLVLEQNPKLNIGFAAFPPMKDGEKPVVLSSVDSTMGIPSKAKNSAGAKAFIKFLLKAENLKKYSETLKLPSAYSNVESNWVADPAAFDDVINNKENVPLAFATYPSSFQSGDSGTMVQGLLAGQYSDTADFTKAYVTAWNKAWEAAE